MGNSRSFRRATAALAATAAGALVLVPAAAAAPAPETLTGPSTTTAPYIVPVAPGVTVTSLLTVGDGSGVAGYPMVGIPDGLGAYAGPDGSFTALMTHELRNTAGALRAHGQKGAFVSKWTIDAKTGAVTAGTDLIRNVIDWDYTTGTYDADTTADSAFARFCSSSLTEPGQLTHKGVGYDGQIFFGNEENGDTARTFGIIMDGVAYQLPRIGLFSSETTVVAPTRSSATVVLGNEDNKPGEIRLYVGTKQASGSPVDKAGLTNGELNVLTVIGSATDEDFRANHGKGTAVPATFTGIDWTKSGTEQNIEAAAKGISLDRIEDGAFDPRKPNDYYFLTTDGGAGTGIGGGGGLWLLRFADVNDPAKGATLTLLLDGTEAPTLNKPDNMTIDNGGNVLIQEDPGGEDVLARVVAYRIADGRTGVVAQFDPAQFTPGAAGFITKDEESSGIIDISALVRKPNTFLLDAQVHSPAASADLVERGQLLTMTVQSWGQVYGG